MENKKLFLTNKQIKEKVNKNKKIQNIKNKNPQIYVKETKNNYNRNDINKINNNNNNITFQNDNKFDFDNSQIIKQYQNNQEYILNCIDDVEIFDEPKKAYNKIMPKAQSSLFMNQNNYDRNVNKIFNHNENLFDNEEYDIIENTDDKKNDLNSSNVPMFEKNYKIDYRNLNQSNSFCVPIKKNNNYNLSSNNFVKKEKNKNDEWKEKLKYINEQKTKMKKSKLTDFSHKKSKEKINIKDENKTERNNNINSKNTYYSNNNDNNNNNDSSSIITFLKPYQKLDKSFGLQKINEEKNDINYKYINYNNIYIKENEIKGRIKKLNNNNNDEELIEDKFTFRINQNNNNLTDNNEVCELEVPTTNANVSGSNEEKTAQFPDVINKENCYKYIPKTLTNYDFYYIKKKNDNNKTKENKVYTKGRYDYLLLEQNNNNKNLLNDKEYNPEFKNYLSQNNFYQNKKDNYNDVGNSISIKRENYKSCESNDISNKNNNKKNDKKDNDKKMIFSNKKKNKKNETLNTTRSSNVYRFNQKLKNMDLYKKNKIQEIQSRLNKKKMKKIRMRNPSFDDTPIFLKKMDTDINDNHQNKSFLKKNNKNEKQKTSRPLYNKPSQNKTTKNNVLIPKNKFAYQQNNNQLIDNLKKIINNNNAKYCTINNSFTESVYNKLLLHNNSVVLYKKKPQKNNNANNMDKLNNNKKEKKKKVIKVEDHYDTINKNYKNNKNNDEKISKLFSRIKQSSNYLKNIKYRSDYCSPQEMNNVKYNKLIMDDNKMKQKVSNLKICRITKFNNYCIKLPKINSISFSKQNIINSDNNCLFTKSDIQIYKLNLIDVCFFSKNYITTQQIIKLPKNNICYFSKIKPSKKEEKNNTIIINKANIRTRKLTDLFEKRIRNKINNNITKNNTLDLDVNINEKNKMNTIYQKKCNTYKKKKKEINTFINDYKLLSPDKFNIINQSVIIYSNNIYPIMINKDKNKNMDFDNLSIIHSNRKRLDQKMINSKNKNKKEDYIIKRFMKKRKRLGTKIEIDDDNNPSEEESQNLSCKFNYENNNIITILKKDIDTFSNFLISNEIYSKSDLMKKNNIKYKWSKTIISLGNNSLDKIIKTFIKICIDNINNENKNDILFIFNEYIKNIIEYYIENINELDINKLHNNIRIMLKTILIDINNTIFEILGNIIFIIIENKLCYIEDINDLLNNDKDFQITISIILKYALLSSGDKIKKYYNDFSKINFHDKDIFNDYVINDNEIISKIK